MSDNSRKVLSTELEGINYLNELALELRVSWDHSTDDIWRKLDPDLWNLTHNPTLVLHAASETRLNELASDTGFRRRVEDFVLLSRQYRHSPGWYQFAHPEAPLAFVAYFSMEFGVCEALPIYSGGLGNVAGDQLKAASDLGIPVVGIGLLYQQGYFRQTIDADGTQGALYPYNSPGELPIAPVRDADGKLVRFELEFPGYKVWLRAWQATIGRVTLYLLDSNDGANMPFHRGITSELYGGGPELRLMQELVLGVGGWRLLQHLKIRADVCHLNEGHAAFAVLERTACFVEQTAKSFEVALTATRSGNLFTTHTPVAAGFDRFDPALVRRYLAPFVAHRLPGVALEDVLALGRRDPGNQSEPFNMAYLAIRGSSAINGVSRLHGSISRAIFNDLFPRWPEAEVPVGYVTNGVHTPTWDSVYAQRLWWTACAKNPWITTMENVSEKISKMPDDLIWGLRESNRKALIEYLRHRLVRQYAAAGESAQEVKLAQNLFDPKVLTLGFARRFATYKRPTLLLRDPERLARILTNPKLPVQLVIAGKAHPADEPGKGMIRQWIQFMKRPEVQHHVAFVADYDIIVAQHLVQGVDLWINTPRRPWEASGTSGMKVLVNGGLNLSELDGWWAEAYRPEVGWAIGDGREHDDDPNWDAAEAESLYDLLEHEVIPAFYSRDEKGIPTGWVTRIRESMARLTPQFSANRTVREYTETYYLPAAESYRKRAANEGALAEEIVKWQRNLRERWGTIRSGALKVESADGFHSFSAEVCFDEALRDSIRVELYADAAAGGYPARISMKRGRKSELGEGFIYSARVFAERPASDYTLRIIPSRDGALVPLEANQIIWAQR